MIPIEAFLFDLDGTLIDSKTDIVRSVQHVQTSLGLKPGESDKISSFIGDGIVTLIQRAAPGLHGSKLEDAVERMKHYYRDHCLDTTRLYPGVVDLLEHFRHKELAVVTNKPERVSRRILTGLKIDGFFKLVLGGDSRSKKKPDPEPLRHALEVLGIQDPKSAVMVGDGINDILAGRAAGVWTCGIQSTISQRSSKQADRADFELQNLNEMMRLFN
jgi:phosphoglycolate phosphatase